MSRATEYAESIVSGEVQACKWIKLAAERHISDLKRSDVYYDLDEEDRRCEFIENILTLEDGSLFSPGALASFHSRVDIRLEI